ncbi:hypothetical protein OEA41_000160 [Lepraria neglecta]|uniref:Uncharacterized protein n=1 Tax=Lepraria neglecta TaxID=209136 RepID=A0AAD9ZI17_9LECA|nr:hypothetical protein OEA41_000160 [Lepraria neglecta]
MALAKPDDALPQSNPQSDIICVMAVYTPWHQQFELTCSKDSPNMPKLSNRAPLVFNVLQENPQPGVGFDTSRARDLITTAEYAPLQTLGLGAELAIWLDGEKAD